MAETVVRACEGFSSLREKGKAKQWLLRILTNTFISSRRAMKARQEVAYDENDEHFSLFDELARPFFWWGNPEQEVMNRFLDEDLKKAVDSLPEEFRVPVILCDVEGYTYKEIAEMLELPIGTVRSRLARGRALLQKRLHHHAVERGWVPATKFSIHERS